MHKRYGKAIIVGDACVDVTVPLKAILATTDGAPKDEELKPKIGGGGTSANTAVSLAKLGVETAFMGTLGADFGGRYIRQEFNDAGIATELTLTDNDSNTVYVFAFIDNRGERKLWAFPREGASYINYDFSAIDPELIKTALWVHASGMTVMFEGNIRKILPQIFKIAHEAGVPTSFDLNTRVSDPKKLDKGIKESILATMPYVRYLLGSAKDEFFSFWPCDDWKESVRHFAENERVVIARMGGEGSLTIRNGIETTQAALKVPVINTTGAGDSFNAGFIAGMLKGLEVEDAVDMAHCVAAYKISHGGARETPNETQLETFRKTIGG